jgi:cytochrome c oxidase subunit 4
MTTISPHDPVPTEVLDGAVKPYSRDKVYVFTAIFLAFVTALEVVAVEVDFFLWSGAMLPPVLILLMGIKFFVVVWIFMHLKFDKPILTWAFYSGFALAIAVYIAMLAMFRYFTGNPQL